MLDLKHLAPYLPYGLKVKTNGIYDGDPIFTMSDLSGLSNISISDVLDSDEKSYVPILRPLSDVGQDLFDEIGFADDNDFIESVLDGHILYYNFIKLVSNHFDVFGLIEQGLAIDANTINHE